MKTFALTLTAATLASAPLFAQVMVEDMDASGGYSQEELMAAYPSVTEEAFIAIDADASGEVSEEELAAAQEAGLLPMSE
ncbi:EF-hand domain-containing protein [Celeribacter sp.]|uniref:EF-hand domain-containing protein n=1 Tax=Celeribacter sp. TaxID=1890673 RepID=UPI003A91D8EB